MKGQRLKPLTFQREKKKKKREYRKEKKFKEAVSANFPNLAKYVNLQI